MATRIRLQRHGKKNQPFYHIVIADGRAPRDGRFIEKLGTYNTLTHPATIKINFERALYWVETGASPTETVRSILKHEGVYLMKHLRGGIAKGAFNEQEAEKKFEAWKQEKESRVSNVKRESADKTREERKKRLDAESKIRETIAKKVAAKYAVEAAKEAKEAEDEVAATEIIDTPTPVEEVVSVVQETTIEEIPTPETPEETTETPAE
ncbi:MAG: 30S ribosomal protein S16 [Lentimicrobiaceae bacterium]|nr:30S ribosomal protein S16 [Lentimicrobiaceae bacterium]